MYHFLKNHVFVCLAGGTAVEMMMERFQPIATEVQWMEGKDSSNEFCGLLREQISMLYQ